ncbi:MAG: TIGR00725 family protein [Candidatus Omnitrophota bacterium]|nr:TIGR00725 family protein [Candidatus Omnitrophota bacterium]
MSPAKTRKKIVAVIGGHTVHKEVEQLAKNLGKKLVKVADYLVCGGLSGVMKAVCQGFKAGNGVTIGIIPSYDKKNANPYVDIVIPTGLGLARNVLVVKSADVVVALPGEAGTLSEIAYCLQFGIPVISLTPLEVTKKQTVTTKFLTGLKSWDIPGVIKVNSIAGAVKKVKEIISSD